MAARYKQMPAGAGLKRTNRWVCQPSTEPFPGSAVAPVAQHRLKVFHWLASGPFSSTRTATQLSRSETQACCPG